MYNDVSMHVDTEAAIANEPYMRKLHPYRVVQHECAVCKLCSEAYLGCCFGSPSLWNEDLCPALAIEEQFAKQLELKRSIVHKKLPPPPDHPTGNLNLDPESPNKSANVTLAPSNDNFAVNDAGSQAALNSPTPEASEMDRMHQTHLGFAWGATRAPNESADVTPDNASPPLNRSSTNWNPRKSRKSVHTKMDDVLNRWGITTASSENPSPQKTGSAYSRISNRMSKTFAGRMLVRQTIHDGAPVKSSVDEGSSYQTRITVSDASLGDPKTRTSTKKAVDILSPRPQNLSNADSHHSTMTGKLVGFLSPRPQASSNDDWRPSKTFQTEPNPKTLKTEPKAKTFKTEPKATAKAQETVLDFVHDKLDLFTRSKDAETQTSQLEDANDAVKTWVKSSGFQNLLHNVVAAVLEELPENPCDFLHNLDFHALRKLDADPLNKNLLSQASTPLPSKPESPPPKKFPDGLGPFALRETEVFGNAFELQTQEDGLRTWTLDQDKPVWQSSEQLTRLAACIATWPIRGRINPLQALDTLPDEDIECMCAPLSAVSFTWSNVEPIEFTAGSEDVVAEVANAGSTEVAFILRGGFVFCDDAENVCGVCTIGPGAKGTGMQFGAPITWDPAWTPALRTRFSRITIQSFKDQGACYYCWVRPHETFLSDVDPPILKYGGFLYLFHEEIVPKHENDAGRQDIVFPLVQVNRTEQKQEGSPLGFKFVKENWSRYAKAFQTPFALLTTTMQDYRGKGFMDEEQYTQLMHAITKLHSGDKGFNMLKGAGNGDADDDNDAMLRWADTLGLSTATQEEPRRRSVRQDMRKKYRKSIHSCIQLNYAVDEDMTDPLTESRTTVRFAAVDDDCEDVDGNDDCENIDGNCGESMTISLQTVDDSMESPREEAPPSPLSPRSEAKASSRSKNKKKSVKPRVDSGVKKSRKANRDKNTGPPPDINGPLYAKLCDMQLDSLEMSSNEILPLMVAGYQLWPWEIMLTFQIDRDVLSRWIKAMEEQCLSNPYHNWLHAWDTYQFVCVELTQGLETVRTMRPDCIQAMDVLALLSATISHDIAHPGVTNQYLVRQFDDLAITYNDSSPLENMHCARLFQTLRRGNAIGDNDQDFLRMLQSDQFNTFRELVIHAILNTDMTSHFKVVDELHVATAGDIALMAPKLIVSSLLKLADISGSLRTFDMYMRKVKLIETEFFAQGDLERELGLPISPMMNRHKPELLHSQSGWNAFVVGPLVEGTKKILPHLGFKWEQQLEENSSAVCNQSMMIIASRQSIDNGNDDKEGDVARQSLKESQKPSNSLQPNKERNSKRAQLARSCSGIPTE